MFIVARVSCSFDRGTEQNTEDNVVNKEAIVEVVPGETVIKKDELRRGLGTRFVSVEAKEKATRLGIEEGRVNRLISRAFLRSPIPGLYLVPSREAVEAELLRINPSPEINCRAVVYVLGSTERNTKEIEEWIKTVKSQLTTAPLGRAKEAGAEGLEIIEKLAQCPALSDDTRNKILGLVGQAKLEQISRVEFKRAIADLDVQMDVNLVEVQPGRVFETPTIAQEMQPEETTFVRREIA